MTKKWWEKLLGELLFAPVYMIMLWIVMTIISSPQFFGSFGNQTSLANSISSPSISNMGLIMNFIVVIILLNAVLIVAKSIAKQGESVGQKIVGIGLGGAANVSGWAGRRFVGGAGRMAANNEFLQEQASKKGIVGMGARLTLRASQGAAGSSFDLRNSKTLGTVAKGAGFDLDKNAGKAGGKGGYNKIIEERVKEREKVSENLQKVSTSTIESRSKDVIEGAEREAENRLDAEKRALRVAQEKAEALRKTDPTSRTVAAEADKARKEAQDLYTKQAAEIEKDKNEKISKARTQAEADAKKAASARGERYVGNVLEKSKVWNVRADREAAQSLRGKMKKKNPVEQAMELLKKQAKEDLEAEQRAQAEQTPPAEPPKPEPPKVT